MRKVILIGATLAAVAAAGVTSASAQNEFAIQSKDFRQSVEGLPPHYGYRGYRHYHRGYGAYGFVPGYHRHHWRHW